VRLGFEGGQWPLYRRIPKRGFNNNAFKVQFAPVNIGALNVFDDGANVDVAALRAKGLVTGKWDGVKILANGELKKKLTISVDAASEAAKAKVAAAGGTLNLPANSEVKK
jgi:large subunit ribosomal protein L15